MSDSKDKRARVPAKEKHAEEKTYFEPIMSLEEAQAQHKGRIVTMEEFKARFGLQ